MSPVLKEVGETPTSDHNNKVLSPTVRFPIKQHLLQLQSSVGASSKQQRVYTAYKVDSSLNKNSKRNERICISYKRTKNQTNQIQMENFTCIESLSGNKQTEKDFQRPLPSMKN